jgi:protein-S-isoprenylcysteine O-methyltransferase Ste14
MKREIILVGLQFTAIALNIIPWRGQIFWNWPGLALIALSGLFFGWILAHNRLGNFNVAPNIRQGAKLVTSGPYKYVRHPMYSAVFIFGIGAILLTQHWLNILGYVLLVAVLIAKMKVEEEHLLAEFGEDYRQMQSNTHRVIPGVY